MRFGCCLNMLSTQPDGTGVEHIEALARMGYDYVELPLAEMMLLPEKEFDALRERVSKSGLRCEACNNFFPKTMRLTGDEATPDAALDYAEKALERAASLGAEIVVFGSGPARNAPEGYPRGRAVIQLGKLLRAISPMAEKHGITIAIEPLRHQECNVVNSFRDACRLAHDVDCPNVRALADFYHFSEEFELADHIVKTGREYLRHAHFARPNGRAFPADWDEYHYKPFVEAFKTVEYNGRVSCEAYTKDFEKDGPKALKFFKEIFG